MAAIALIERGRIDRRAYRVGSAGLPVLARPVGAQYKEAFHGADEQKNVAVGGGNMMDGRQGYLRMSTSCAEIILDAERHFGLEARLPVLAISCEKRGRVSCYGLSAFTGAGAGTSSTAQSGRMGPSRGSSNPSISIPSIGGPSPGPSSFFCCLFSDLARCFSLRACSFWRFANVVREPWATVTSRWDQGAGAGQQILWLRACSPGPRGQTPGSALAWFRARSLLLFQSWR